MDVGSVRGQEKGSLDSIVIITVHYFFSITVFEDRKNKAYIYTQLPAEHAIHRTPSKERSVFSTKLITESTNCTKHITSTSITRFPRKWTNIKKTE